jgi:K+-sensing histidine kinase KdpD
MKTKALRGDPALDFVLGRDGECLSLPSSIGVTFVAGLILAAAVAADLLDPTLAFGALVVVVAAVGWWSSPATAAVAGLVGFLFANGFLLDKAGTLAWHGGDDIVRLAVMVFLAVVAALLGRLRDEHRHRATANSSPTVHAGR